MIYMLAVHYLKPILLYLNI